LRNGTHTFYPPGADAPERFWLRQPEGLDHRQRHPLLVFLHGHGGNHRLPWSLPELQTLREGLLAAGFICVSPDFGPNHWMNAAARHKLAALLDLLPARLPVDPQRVHLLGLSMGGAGGLIFAAHHPGRVRSVCTAMAVTDFPRFYAEGRYQALLREAFGGSPAEVPEVYRAQSPVHCLERLAGVSVLVLHGTEDDTVPVWHAREFVARRRAAGQSVAYREVEGIGHQPEIVHGYEAEIVRFFMNCCAS
jgi:dipeptidyl aminopeptidase/acylaminoacyl peptidase